MKSQSLSLQEPKILRLHLIQIVFSSFFSVVAVKDYKLFCKTFI